MKDLIDNKVWQGRLRLATEHMEKHGNTSQRWEANKRALAGDFNSIAELGEEAIDVNLVRSTVKTVLPGLYISDPTISITPSVARSNGKNNVEMARFTSIEINYWFRELGIRLQAKKVAHDAEITNVGYIYVGQISSDIDEKAAMSTNVKKGQPFAVRFPPMNVLVPPGYEDLDEAPWVALKFLRPLEYVKEKFDADRIVDIPSKDYRDKSATSDETEMKEYLESDDSKVVVVLNVWCRETKKVYVVVPKHDQFLEEPRAWPFKMEGFPLERYQPDYVPDEYYGSPPISSYLPQNKELNSTRTAMRQRRSRTKGIILASSSLGTEFVGNYKSAKDNEVVTFEDEDGEDIRKKLIVDTGLPFDSGDLAYDQVIKSDIREASGLGSEQLGAGDPHADSATASQNIARGESVRAADRADGIRMLYINVARKLWMILKQKPNIERSRLIGGDMAGSFAEVAYSLADIDGEFDFSMEVGTALSQTPQEKQNLAAMRYNMLRADPLVNPNRLIQDVLDSMLVPDPATYMMLLKTPEEEHQVIQQGLPVTAQERDDHQFHMNAHAQMAEKLNDALSSLNSQDRESPVGSLLILAQHLLIAHIHDHGRIIQELTGNQAFAGGPPQAGAPQDEQQRGVQEKKNDNVETDAELRGQPAVA
jgi:hypothetical protein